MDIEESLFVHKKYHWLHLSRNVYSPEEKCQFWLLPLEKKHIFVVITVLESSSPLLIRSRWCQAPPFASISKAKMAAVAILKMGNTSIVLWLHHSFSLLISFLHLHIFNIWLHKHEVWVFPMIFVTKTALSFFFWCQMWNISEINILWFYWALLSNR